MLANRSKHLMVLLTVIAVLVTGCGNDPSLEDTAADTTTAPDNFTATLAADRADSTAPEERLGDEWPAYGFDHANSVHNRDETILSTANVADLVPTWTLEAGAVTGTPVVADGIVYFGDWHGVIHALDAMDGSTTWETDLGDVVLSASVAVTEGAVIAADLLGDLHAVDRRTGSPIWSVSIVGHEAGVFSSPVVIDDLVVVATTSPVFGPVEPGFRAAIVAFDVETGVKRWRLNTDPDDDESETWVAVWSSAAYDVERGLIFIGTGNTNVAVPSASGVNDSAGRSSTDLPWSDGVLAIGHDTGEVRWFHQVIEEDNKRDFDVGASPNLFTIDDRDVIGVGGKSGVYVVLDRDSGELLWQAQLTEGSDIGGVMSTAAIGDGVIYVSSNDGGPRGGTIFALDVADGSQLWQHRSEHAIIGGSMALANGVVYRGTWAPFASTGTALALDAETGTVLWTDPIDAPLAGGFSIVNGTLYVGFGSGLPPTLGAANGGLIAYRLP
ncbi:MAG: PQQ-binding-like beta-propeller repeat protein [Acidimicrobiales bacterium]